MDNYYKISTPIGGSYGDKNIPYDMNVKFVEIISHRDNKNICLNIFFNKEYIKMNEFFDEKYPYKGKHFILNMTIEEAINLRNSLDEHIKNNG